MVGDEIRVFVGVSWSVHGWYTSNAANLATDTWYCVAGTWDGSAFKLYVNGKEEAGTTTTVGSFPATMRDSSVPVEIGALHSVLSYGGNRGDYFDGKIDKVSIFDRVLSEEQIACYCSCITSEKEQVHFWSDVGSTISDSSPETLNGAGSGTAVKAWEHNSWKKVNEPEWTGSPAEWVWESYQVQQAETYGSWCKFEEKFRLCCNAALNDLTTGWLKVQADNEHRVVINGVEIGTSTNFYPFPGYSNPDAYCWNTVYNYPLTGSDLKHGENIVEITVMNLDGTHSPTANPAAVIYECKIELACCAVAVYHMNEGSGSTAYDETCNNNDGTVHGATWTSSGKYGSCLDFDGSSDYVQVPDDKSLEPQELTVDCWVKGATQGSYRYIIAKGANACSSASYAFYTGSSGGLYFYVTTAGGWTLSPDGGSSLWDDCWHHIAGTYDGSYIRLYVDGSEVGSGTVKTGNIRYNMPTNDELFIGAYRGTCNFYFNGLIDEVNIWPCAMSASQIQTIYGETWGTPHWAHSVVSSSQGLRKDGTPVVAARSNPANALGPTGTGQSESNFFSLGFGGQIVVKFAKPVGGSLTITEDTWGSYPPETADVFVSKDGTNWGYIGQATNNNGLGGNQHATTFTLTTCIQYVKIVDTSNAGAHGGNADAFDVNSVYAEYEAKCCCEPCCPCYKKCKVEVEYKTLTIDFTGAACGDWTGNEMVYIDYIGYKQDGDQITVPLGSTVYYRAYYQQGSGLYGPKLNRLVDCSWDTLEVEFKTITIDLNGATSGNEAVYIDYIGYKSDTDNIVVPMGCTLRYRGYYTQGSGLYGDKLTSPTVDCSWDTLTVNFKTLTFEVRACPILVDGAQIYVDYVGYVSNGGTVTVPDTSTVRHKAVKDGVWSWKDSKKVDCTWSTATWKWDSSTNSFISVNYT
jgi:hypothetical protein